MQLYPMISSLRHHRLTGFMLLLQIAFTCAIVCNVVFLIINHIKQINLPTGIANDQLSVIISTDLRKNDNFQAQLTADLAALRKIPGVNSVAATNLSLPLGDSDHTNWMCNSNKAMEKTYHSGSPAAGCAAPSVYGGSVGMVETLGLHLSAGRAFRSDEFVVDSMHKLVKPTSIIISRSLATRLFPHRNALGRNLYVGTNEPVRIIGIVDNLLRPRLYTADTNYYSALTPVIPNFSSVLYVLRSKPKDRQRVLKSALAALNELNPDRMIGQKETYERMHHDYFKTDFTMINLLLAAVSGLLFVTALGITGLASFWVQQRTRTIGIRRALGATRADILRYFQMENFFIVSVGVVAGSILAVVLNLALMRFYEIPRLPLYYLPISAIAVWLLGQLAVLSPALRAAAVPPATATRNV